MARKKISSGLRGAFTKWGLALILFGWSVTFVLAGTLCVHVAEISGLLLTDCYPIGNQPDQDVYFDCVDIHPCEYCGMCHTKSNKDLAKTWEKNTLSEHQKDHFVKSQYFLPPGREYREKDYVLKVENRQLIKYIPKDKKAVLYPFGSIILKNKTGNPALIYSPSKPKIVSRSIRKR